MRQGLHCAALCALCACMLRAVQGRFALFAGHCAHACYSKTGIVQTLMRMRASAGAGWARNRIFLQETCAGF